MRDSTETTQAEGRGFPSRYGFLLSALVSILLLGVAPVTFAQVTFNGVVSLLSTDGTVTLSQPGGVALDSSGNVYIADSTNNRIVKVNPQDSASLLPITGLNPALSNPQGIAVNSAGTLYIADPMNNRIVEVSSSGGSASVLGTGTVSLSGPSGVAVDALGNIFVADTGHNRVIEVTVGGKASELTTSLMTLSSPDGLAVDTSGNLYIADSGNNRIVKAMPGGAASVLSITGLATPLSGPRGVGVDTAANVYILDTGNNRVVRVTPEGAGSELTTDPLPLSEPHGIAVDVFGTVYIADTAASQVVTLSTSAVGFGHVQLGNTSGVTRALRFTVPPDTTLGGVDAFTLGVPNLDFMVASGTTCNAGITGTTCAVNIRFLPTAPGFRRGALVLRDNASPAAPLAEIPLYGTADAPVAALAPHTAAVINTGGVSTASPFSIALDGSANMYVGNFTLGNVVEVPAGGGMGSAVSVSGEPLAAVTGVAIDGAGNLFIADAGRSRILVVTPGGTASVLGISGLSAGLSEPYGLAFDAAGSLYIADHGNSRVVKVSSLIVQGATSSGVGSVISTGGFSLGHPTGVAVDPAGTIFVADPSNDRVLQITAGRMASSVNPSGTAPGLSTPQGVGVDPMGNLYIADTGNNRIVEVTTAGVASVVSTPGLSSPSTLGAPSAVTVDATGNIFIADSNNHRIVEVPASGAALAFPRTKVGSTSSSQTATITNVGNQPLVFAASPGYPANFSEHSGDPNLCTSATVLSAGAACDVSVEFTPRSAGNLSASVTRTNNALNLANNMQQVLVSGTSSDPADTTATTVAPSATSVIIGQTITLTATVADTTNTSTVPTGEVTFTDTVGTTLTSLNNGVGVTLNGAGQAVLSNVLLRGAGMHTITAIYAGVSGTILTSTGTATVSVNQASVTIALKPTGVIVFGQTGSIAATVTAPYTTVAQPTGTLSYSILNGSSTVVASGTVPLTAGTTNSNTTIPVPNTLAPGAYTVSVTYSGDSNYLSVSSPTALSLNVAQASPTVSLRSSLNPVLTTNAVTFTATVSSPSGTPTGSVNFLDGQTLLSSVPLTPGMATYTTSSLAIGNHSITAKYGGDTNFASVSSAVLAQLVIDFTLTVFTPPGEPVTPTVLPGATANYTLQVAPSEGQFIPSAMTFAITGLPAGAKATFTPPTLAAGSPATNVNLAIQLAQQVVTGQLPVTPLGRRLALAMVGGIFLLPFVRRKLSRPAGRSGTFAALALLLIALACTTLGLTGCAGGRSGYFGQQERNYSMTVTATSGALSHTTTVTLTVE